ncbi:unnamed protein product [Adineta steineri]|uniref:SCP domain-containing protein n=1 Tax=Adineta steineri TaxID=433720 RepID=A0A818XHQ2_9BILA|nr:unnamed protein product [Adineta steineri]
MSFVWIIFLCFILTLKATELNQNHPNFIKSVNQTAENIALNSGRSAQYTVNQWMKSPKHRASILNPKYNQVGIGAIQKNQKIWWTMLMARGSDKCVLPKKS